MTQAHIFYSGMVQGIGFRYTVLRFCQSIGELSGWVRNLSDGRVEILVEGKKEKIEQLVKNIDQHFGGYIRQKELQFSVAAGEFQDFQVTYE